MSMFNDFDILMRKDFKTSRVIERRKLIAKYQLEQVYYAVIQNVLNIYGIDPIVINDGKEEKLINDGKNIANINLSALSIVRDDIVRGLQKRGIVKYDKMFANGFIAGAVEQEFDPSGDLLRNNFNPNILGSNPDVVAGVKDSNGREVGELTLDTLVNIAKEALLSSESLYTAIQNKLAITEFNADNPISDEKLIQVTEDKIKEMLDTTKTDSWISKLRDNCLKYIAENENYEIAKIENQKRELNDAEKETIKRSSEDSIYNPYSNWSRIKEYKFDIGKNTYKYEKNENTYKNDRELMLKISPLMPGVREFLETASLNGRFEHVLDNNGFLMFDSYRNMLRTAPVNFDEYENIESKVDDNRSNGVLTTGIVLGNSELMQRFIENPIREIEEINYTDENGKVTSTDIIDVTHGFIDFTNNDIYEALNIRFKTRMIELLEFYSGRSLNDKDIDIINKIFDNFSSNGDDSIFDGDITGYEDSLGQKIENIPEDKRKYAKILMRAEAYFDYIEHICQKMRENITSNEFEIHLENLNNKSFSPILYATGLRTDNYFDAKRDNSKFIGVHIYSSYDPKNKIVGMAMGDIECPDRDGYRFGSQSAHINGNEAGANRYYNGHITLDKIENMRNVFDAYIGDTVSSDTGIYKISRTESDIKLFDAAKFVDPDGNIDFNAVINRLREDRDNTKNNMYNIFVSNRKQNIEMFESMITEFGSKSGLEFDRDKLINIFSDIVIGKVRESLDEDRNNFTVRRHIFLNYAQQYIDTLMAKTEELSENNDDKLDIFIRLINSENAKDKINIIADDIDKNNSEILNKSLDELFGYGTVIKANMCKYMSTTVSSYDDYEKLLTLLSYSSRVKYETDKIEIFDDKSEDLKTNDCIIQLYSSSAFDEDRFKRNLDDNGRTNIDIEDLNDNREDIESNTDTIYDDEMWYASTFAELQDTDISYADILKNSNDMILFKATHPLQSEALRMIADSVSNTYIKNNSNFIHESDNKFNPEHLKITKSGIIYYVGNRGDADNSIPVIDFKIGPVLDERAYIHPIVEQFDEETENAREVITYETDDRGNFVYDENGIRKLVNKWIKLDYNIKIENGKVVNDISFGALDVSESINNTAYLNRIYGMPAKVKNWDRFKYSDSEIYANRVEIGTYQMSVLDNIKRQFAERFAALNTYGEITDEIELGNMKKIASAAAYNMINSCSLMKCYRTNTYILNNKTPCILADAYLYDYNDTMRNAFDIIKNIDINNADENDKRLYNAVQSGDMDELDVLWDDYRNKKITLSEKSVSCLEEINKLYKNISENSRDDLVARRKYRENAYFVLSQAEMYRDRVITAKILIDQNIGLKEMSLNALQMIKGIAIGDLDIKAMANTDGLSGRAVYAEYNRYFDKEYTATAKQMGAVLFLGDNVHIDKITGQIIKDGNDITRAFLGAAGVINFATGSQDCCFVVYPENKAVDRSQLSMNAIEKALGYERLNMAMISSWSNMEDGYIISKKAAKKLGHFDENNNYIAAETFDKIGDSESGNKGIIAKIVDTDIETEDELKIKLAREYIQDRSINGKDISDDEEFHVLIDRYNNCFDRFGNIKIIDDSVYLKLYDLFESDAIKSRDLTIRDLPGHAYEFNEKITQKTHDSDAEKIEIVREFINDKTQNELVDNIFVADLWEKLSLIDSNLVPSDLIGGHNYVNELNEISKNIADYMLENKIEPWTGHYVQEKFLWQLFKDNDDLDVVVTDACVNTRANPSLVRYICDYNDYDENGEFRGLKMRSEDNKLIECKNAKGTITVYLDSHLGSEKNVSYVQKTFKSGRGIGSQEMFMLSAKHAIPFVEFVALNDKRLPENIKRFNRKLIMNGLIQDSEDLDYKKLSDVINTETEFEKLNDNNLIYKSDSIPGMAFVDMQKYLQKTADKFVNNINFKNSYSNKLITECVDDILKNRDAFTKMFAVIDGYKSDVTASNSLSTENRLRNMFIQMFGDGGSFMMLPKDLCNVYIGHGKKSVKSNDYTDDYNAYILDSMDDDYYYGGTDTDYNDQNQYDISLKLSNDIVVNGQQYTTLPLFISSYESINEDAETTTAKIDDRLQVNIFKSIFGYMMLDALEKSSKFQDNGNSSQKENISKAKEQLIKNIEREYDKISDGSNKSLNMENKVARYLKKNLYRFNFPYSATCVWHGNPNINIDEVGMSFELAKELGYLRPRKDISKEDLKKIPDDYAHLHLKYEPVDQNKDFVWVNRSPGQTTGCARMFKLRIIDQPGMGVQVHPAVATIFDGDFDGDTVGVANPLKISKDSVLYEMKKEKTDEWKKLQQGILNTVKQTMTMSANMVKTADFDEISYGDNNKKTFTVYPLFIAQNADIAIACFNMKEAGCPVDEKLDRITVMANIAEQAKQILNDGVCGINTQINSEHADAIKLKRVELLKQYYDYIQDDKLKHGEDPEWRSKWGSIYDETEKLLNIFKDDDGNLTIKCNDNKKKVRNQICKFEQNIMEKFSRVYQDMEGYVAKKPCFTHGENDLDLVYNKIADSNINKKGKLPQLNAFILFAGMHIDCVKNYIAKQKVKDPEYKPDVKYGLKIEKVNDRFETCVYDINSDNPIGYLNHNKKGELVVTNFDDKNSKKLAQEISKQLKFNSEMAKSDLPYNKFRSENELNASAQGNKSDGTGIGGAVAQKFQLLFSCYGYGELGLRISGPITQKYLDAKQNVGDCSRNLKIGKFILGSVCKGVRVEELCQDDSKITPDQIYRGAYTVNKKSTMTINTYVEQVNKLLKAFGQPEFSEIDKQIVKSCVHQMQEDYYNACGKQSGDTKAKAYEEYIKKNGVKNIDNEPIVYSIGDMFKLMSDKALREEYVTNDGEYVSNICKNLGQTTNIKTMFDIPNEVISKAFSLDETKYQDWVELDIGIKTAFENDIKDNNNEHENSKANDNEHEDPDANYEEGDVSDIDGLNMKQQLRNVCGDNNDIEDSEERCPVD